LLRSRREHEALTVTVKIDQATAAAAAGTSLFAVAEQLGVRVPTSCHGNGKCRECLVEVTHGMDRLTERTAAEAHLGASFRLACQTRIANGEGKIRCHTLRRGAIRIVRSGVDLPVLDGPPPLDPAVRRNGQAIWLDDQPIAQSDGPVLGLAIDCGTTTVVVRLVDLESGQIVAAQAFENPQRFGGSDVLARVLYDSQHKGQLLRRTLLGYLTHAIESFPCDPQSIFEVTVAGNPVMRDLFFGLDVHSIGQKPFRSLVEHEYLAGQRSSTSVVLSGKRARIPIHPAGRVYGLPLIGCHVGADAAACLLAVQMAHEERTIALMDIGTNTELVVGRPGRIHAASCPAGPAFEGGAIQCGMPALEGAIQRVAIDPSGDVQLGVIGDCRPVGICGSGLLDVVAELLRTGRMNPIGRLRDGADRFVLDAANEIYITEQDISQLAQAKAANTAGLQLVLRNFGVDLADLDRFYLAGGFARHLDLDSARRIGLIPDLPDDKIVQVGNASLEGATVALTSATQRRELEELVKGIEHVELETLTDFFDFFIEGIQFAPLQSSGDGRVWRT
jgi:uncharacterized 2Fe-2S/4Fe-4S cluster protein (DUF4445 family)